MYKFKQQITFYLIYVKLNAVFHENLINIEGAEYTLNYENIYSW